MKREEEIIQYLIGKGYPVSTGGDIPTFEQSMQSMTELYNYQKNNWMEIACKWLEKESAGETYPEKLKEIFIEVMGS